MDSNRKSERQKIMLTLYSFTSNDEKELFGSWPIFIGQKYIIGRGKESDISINSLLLSRRQIELTYYTNNLIIIKDLNSRNGTFINNVKVSPNQEIKFTSKDKLSFGNQNNVVEFHEYFEKKKSIFDEKAKGKIVENRNRNEIENKRLEVNQLPNNRNTNNRFKTRISSVPQRNRNNLNETSDSVDTEIRMKADYTKNDNLENNRYRRNQNSYRYNYNNKYRTNYYNQNNRRKYDDDYNNNKENNTNRFIGRKYGRNMNNRNDNNNRNDIRYDNRYDNRRNYNRYDNGNPNTRRKNYVQYRRTETEKTKLNEEIYERNKKIQDELENNLINILNGKSDENNQITLKENKNNGLDLVMPINDKNLMELKKFKKTKLAVKGFLELDLDK